jgi:hypothetical protein
LLLLVLALRIKAPLVFLFLALALGLALLSHRTFFTILILSPRESAGTRQRH